MSSLSIRVEGLAETLKGLREIDRELPKEVKRGLREDVRPLFAAYQSYARGLGGSGQYAANASIRTISAGVKIANSDPGAGPIEFANPGAFYLNGPRAGRRMGVPHAGKPRALMRAVDEYEDEVRDRVESRIEKVIQRYLNG